MDNKCERCGKPCRFLLCAACYAAPVEGDYADVNLTPGATLYPSWVQPDEDK